MKYGKYVVLLVEDDQKQREELSGYLSGQQFHVLETWSEENTLKVFFSNNHEIDMILINLTLQEGSGREILKTIREYSSVPIVLMGERESEEDLLEALMIGADNYYIKPLRLRVLQVYMEALLRRRMDGAGKIRFGKLSILPEAQQVFLENRELGLTPKEFSLLLFFVRNSNQVLRRETILDSVWGYGYEGDIRTVDSLVKQLRKKLTDHCPYIRSIYGFGYMFRSDEEDGTSVSPERENMFPEKKEEEI